MMNQKDPIPAVAVNEFLVFTLGSEEYGIDILKVQEIRSYETVTRIANTPDFIKGVINLRGEIVPIIDLRVRFHLGEIRYDEFTVVIVLRLVERLVGSLRKKRPITGHRKFFTQYNQRDIFSPHL